MQIQTQPSQPSGSSDLVVQVSSSSLFLPRQNSLLRLYLYIAGQLGVQINAREFLHCPWHLRAQRRPDRQVKPICYPSALGFHCPNQTPAAHSKQQLHIAAASPESSSMRLLERLAFQHPAEWLHTTKLTDRTQLFVPTAVSCSERQAQCVRLDFCKQSPVKSLWLHKSSTCASL